MNISYIDSFDHSKLYKMKHICYCEWIYEMFLRCPTYVGRRISSWNQFRAFDVYYVIIIKTQKKEKKVLSYRKSCQGQTWLDDFFLQNIILKDFSFFIVQEHKQACFVFYSWIFHEWNWNYSNPISKKCFDDLLSWANI